MNSEDSLLKKELLLITICSFICFCIMLLVYYFLNKLTYKVFIGGLMGTAYILFNYSLLARTVKMIAEIGDKETGIQQIRKSYTFRMMGMCIVAGLAFLLPVSEGIPCIISFLFPRITIMLLQISGLIQK